MNTKHTPINKKVNITLPLCLSQQHYEPFLWELNEDNGDGDCIGTIYGSSQDDKENLEESQTRAAYICRACNEYESDRQKIKALKEALNGLISASATVFDHAAHLKNSVKLDYITYKAKAEQALKLAEGRE